MKNQRWISQNDHQIIFLLMEIESTKDGNEYLAINILAIQYIGESRSHLLLYLISFIPMPYPPRLCLLIIFERNSCHLKFQCIFFLFYSNKHTLGKFVYTSFHGTSMKSRKAFPLYNKFNVWCGCFYGRNNIKNELNFQRFLWKSFL